MQNPLPNEPPRRVPLPSSAGVCELAPGDVFAERFRVVRKLASGGVGHVYEALNVWTTRRVALKFLRAEVAGNEEVNQRFQLEAEAATRVAHPNVVEVIDMGRDRDTGQLYIVQEFLEGGDLQDHFTKRKRLSFVETMAVMAPVMRALQVAHERGVIHRDLKPENIFLTRSPEGELVPKVIDFGLARLTPRAQQITGGSAVHGTPFYMSPEQASGDRDLDARTDVWSVGVIWYELLAGHGPFRGADVPDLFDNILHDEPAPLDELVPDVPPALAEAVHKALAKNRELRFASMSEFLAAITRASDIPDALVAAAPIVTARRSRWRAALPIAALVVLAPLAGWRIARSGAAPTAPMATQVARMALTPAAPPLPRVVEAAPIDPAPFAPATVAPVVVAAPVEAPSGPRRRRSSRAHHHHHHRR